jgi:pyruvate dehydrogenase E2 component (dihydrolipoamide acetyltransferase)
MSAREFRLPDIGEGLTEADIISWSVQPGDTVVVNQVLVEVETAKAAVELPSPWAGTVTELHAAEGETVEVGRPIITIDAIGDAQAAGVVPAANRTAANTTNGATPSGQGSSERQPVLVGYGPRSGATARRRRKADAHPAPSVNAAFNATTVTPPAVESVPPPPAPPVPAPARTNGERHSVLAKPPVRKLAKSLGVDLGTLAPTGPNGTVSREDVEGAARRGDETVAAQPPTTRETRIPIRGIRKRTAEAMVSSAFTAPHVTEFITVDVTATVELRDRVSTRPEFRDVKLSPLAFLARAVILAVGRTPELNSSWDEAAGEIVQKHYVNLGIAAATDRGLIVPNIKDAQQLSLVELATAINGLASTARAGRSTPADLTGGTITITNVGVFGIDTGTPIINPGEAGIVAFGAVRRQPWVVTAADGGEVIAPRWVTQLAVSFDHRLADGQQGSQFLADVAGIMADPGLALL